ncbi:hypothetical protein [Streptomyces sulphureus]|uniref:hypothetical protein n=1 Tax=Streptomyces sulphureus TaxID=47758 RepID=UPI00131A1EDE|nr:hypothetical protein [Streptomyces sulphureus]
MSETTLALVAIIISVVVGAVTFAYTHQQMKKARRANALTEKAQQEQVQPYVVADIRETVPGSHVFTLSLRTPGQPWRGTCR